MIHWRIRSGVCSSTGPAWYTEPTRHSCRYRAAEVSWAAPAPGMMTAGTLGHEFLGLGPGGRVAVEEHLTH